MPNLLANAVLVLWPAVTLALCLRLRLAPGRAIIAAILAGYLLLPPAPAALDLPLLPDLGKEELPALAAFVIALVLWRPGLSILPESPVLRALLVLYVLSPVGSSLTNPEPLVYGPRVLPGLGLREAGGAVILQAIKVMPFLLARHFLARPEDRRDLILALMIGGLAYSLPVLVEIRLAPQINVWVYGFFQHSFEQMMRAGGFRPIVFLYHALWVAFFMMTALVAAAAVARERGGGAVAVVVVLWLAAILVLGKSYAAILYALLLVPAVLVLSPRWQVHLAALFAVAALAWPVARIVDVAPVDTIVAMASELGQDRAHSLDFRFDNERALTARAMEKPVFGWGIWGRNQIYSPQDGSELSITDGRWIVVLGMQGLVGLAAEFGLLALPLLGVWRRRRDIAGDDGAIWTGALALILGVNMLDLLPNATLTPLTWLVAGAVLAVAETRQAAAVASAPAPAATAPIATVL
ncbi:MAG: hypothetical protein H3C51_03450 [Rubellimicrobium sp.]|nr:hypothetical protein [Rubellimicrobium sp.]